jgi:hypothetical protein
MQNGAWVFEGCQIKHSADVYLPLTWGMGVRVLGYIPSIHVEQSIVHTEYLALFRHLATQGLALKGA